MKESKITSRVSPEVKKKLKAVHKRISKKAQDKGIPVPHIGTIVDNALKHYLNNNENVIWDEIWKIN